MTLLSCGQICQQYRQFIRMHDGSKTFFFHMHCGFPKGSGIVALPRWSHAATENITTKNFGYTKIEHWLKKLEKNETHRRNHRCDVQGLSFGIVPKS